MLQYIYTRLMLQLPRYGDDGKERCPTSFPDPNFLGASFNKSVWLEMGKVIGLELRSLWLQVHSLW